MMYYKTSLSLLKNTQIQYWHMIGNNASSWNETGVGKDGQRRL